MSLYELLTIVLSSFAILISAFSLIQNHRMTKRQAILEKKQIELTEKQLRLVEKEESKKEKAIIKLAIIKHTKNYKLQIRNDGFAPAYNLNLQIISREGKGSPLIQSDYNSKFPLKKLDPGDIVDLFWATDTSTGSDFDAICKWKNQDGKEEIKEALLS